jgi:hypothetical protein
MGFVSIFGLSSFGLLVAHESVGLLLMVCGQFAFSTLLAFSA